MTGKQRNKLLRKIRRRHSDHLRPKQTDGKTILKHKNDIDKLLEFKISEEENNTINNLDLSSHRNTNNIDLGIYRKTTHTDIIIQFSSNHPLEHKLAALNFYINNDNTTNHKTN